MAGLDIQISIAGMPDVIKALESIDKRYRNKGLRRAVSAASKLVNKAAKANLKRNGSFDTKALYRAIGWKIKRYQAGLLWVGIVGPRKDAPGKPPRFRIKARRRGSKKEITVNPVKYAHLVEFGTRAHHIGLGSNSRRGRKFGKLHPGARPKPFLRPAIDENAQTAANLMIQELRRTLTEVS